MKDNKDNNINNISNINNNMTESTINLIELMEKYMLTTENIRNVDIIKSTSTFKQNNIRINKEKPNTSKLNNNLFIPEQKDTLFWCMYIILNELYNYESVVNYFTEENEIKIKWIEELRNNKSIFKTIKISRNSIEEELSSNNKITMKTIKALCYLKNINVFYIDNKKYYEILTHEDNPFYIIEKINGEYGLKQNINNDKLEYYRNNYWKLSNLDKPLKAISSYKSSELKEICSRLNITFNKVKITKPEMYEIILSKL